MIVVTGAAGFIGSCLVKMLNENRFFDVIAVDDFSSKEKLKNLEQAQLAGIVHRENFEEWLEQYQDLSLIHI